RRDGVIGLAFALRQVAQLVLMCAAHDIGISIDGAEPVRLARPEPVEGRARSGQAPAEPSPRIFIYDNYPGGIGFSAPLYEMHEELLSNTRRLIADCPCESGCPGCVGPAGSTGPLAKTAALRILKLLASG